jgi:hypothetical protein
MNLDNYHPDFVLNYDETMIFRDSLPSKIIEEQGTVNVRVKSSGKEKLGYTVGVSVTMGGKMLSSLIVWPSKGVKKFKINTPDNLFIEYREAGSWIDKNILKKYVRGVYRPFFRSKPPDIRGLIIMDNHESHLSQYVFDSIKEFNVDLLYFPLTAQPTSNLWM